MIRVILLHLLIDCLGQQISRKKFIDKAFSLLVIKLRSFAANRLGDQEAAFLLILRIECRRMNLHIIDIFQFYIMDQ